MLMALVLKRFVYCLLATVSVQRYVEFICRYHWPVPYCLHYWLRVAPGETRYMADTDYSPWLYSARTLDGSATLSAGEVGDTPLSRDLQWSSCNEGDPNCYNYFRVRQAACCVDAKPCLDAFGGKSHTALPTSNLCPACLSLLVQLWPHSDGKIPVITKSGGGLVASLIYAAQ